MTILTVDKWMVKPEKQAEHKKLMQKFRKFKKDNAEMFKEMKLLGEYTQMFGGVSGMYVWLVEYDSLADLEKTRVSKARYRAWICGACGWDLNATYIGEITRFSPQTLPFFFCPRSSFSAI